MILPAGITTWLATRFVGKIILSKFKYIFYDIKSSNPMDTLLYSTTSNFFLSRCNVRYHSALLTYRPVSIKPLSCGQDNKHRGFGGLT